MPGMATPIRPTSAPAILDRAFSDLLGKVRQLDENQPKPVVRDATINILFSGGGASLPSSGLGGIVEVPFPCSIAWAHMFAGDDNLTFTAVTAVVDVRYSRPLLAQSSSPLYGASAPSLISQAAIAIDVTDWMQHLTTQDAIMYRLETFIGTATWLALIIGIRSTAGDEGIVGLVDAAGDELTVGGEPLVLRS